MGMFWANPKATPAGSEAPLADNQGDPIKAFFNYARIVGMLQYLQGRIIPEITFAVSQCNRYSTAYKHAQYWIGEYW